MQFQCIYRSYAHFYVFTKTNTITATFSRALCTGAVGKPFPRGNHSSKHYTLPNCIHFSAIGFRRILMETRKLYLNYLKFQREYEMFSQNFCLIFICCFTTVAIERSSGLHSHPLYIRPLVVHEARSRHRRICMPKFHKYRDFIATVDREDFQWDPGQENLPTRLIATDRDYMQRLPRGGSFF